MNDSLQKLHKKYKVYLESDVQNVTKKGKLYSITLRKGNTAQVVKAEALLITAGITPNSDLLKVEKTGVKINERGYIAVNEYMETSVPGIWALGDIVGKAPFKHGANFEAKHVFWNLRGNKKYAVDYSVMPHAIFTSPQIAGVGLTEEQAKEQGIAYEVRRGDYKTSGMGKAIEENDGFVKFIVDKKHDKILGCHILGPEASILIHEVIVAMAGAGGSISAIKNSIHIHPALSEVVQRAL